MNSKFSTGVIIIVLAALFYFLGWPFINSSISTKYFLSVHSEGSPVEAYDVDFDLSDNSLFVENYSYANLATGEGSTSAGESKTYEVTAPASALEKARTILDSMKGFHIFVRHHNGYSYYYDYQGVTNTFYTNDEKTILLRTAAALAEVARGDTKIKRGLTYEQQGEKHLDQLIEELDL